MSVRSVEWRCVLCDTSDGQPFTRKSRWKEHMSRVHQLEEEQVRELAGQTEEDHMRQDGTSEVADVSGVARKESGADTNQSGGAARPVDTQQTSDATPTTQAVIGAPLGTGHVAAVLPSPSRPPESESLGAAHTPADSGEITTPANAPLSPRDGPALPASPLQSAASDVAAAPSSSTPPRALFKLAERKRRTPAEQRRKSGHAQLAGSDEDEDQPQTGDLSETPTSSSPLKFRIKRVPQPSVRHSDAALTTHRHTPSPLTAAAATAADRDAGAGSSWPDAPPGHSCHMCKMMKPGSLLECHYYRHPEYVPRGRPCHRRYCFACLVKHYGIRHQEVDGTFWQCPGCEQRCACSSCTSKRKMARIRAEQAGMAAPRAPIMTTAPAQPVRVPSNHRPPMLPTQMSGTRMSEPTSLQNGTSAARQNPPSSSPLPPPLPLPPIMTAPFFQPPLLQPHPHPHPPFIPTSPPERVDVVAGSELSRTVGPTERHLIVPQICLPNTLAISVRMPDDARESHGFPPFSVHFPKAGIPLTLPPRAHYHINNLALDDPYLEPTAHGDSDTAPMMEDDEKSSGFILKEKAGTAPIVVLHVYVHSLSPTHGHAHATHKQATNGVLSAPRIPPTAAGDDSDGASASDDSGTDGSDSERDDEDDVAVAKKRKPDSDLLGGATKKQRDASIDASSSDTLQPPANSALPFPTLPPFNFLAPIPMPAPAVGPPAHTTAPPPPPARNNDDAFSSVHAQLMSHLHSAVNHPELPAPRLRQTPASATAAWPPAQPVQCPECKRFYRSVGSLRKHQATQHGNTMTICEACQVTFLSAKAWRWHRCAAKAQAS